MSEKARLHITQSLQTRIRTHLDLLYGSEQVDSLWQRLETILNTFHQRSMAQEVTSSAKALTERDAILITYADQFQEPGAPPLRTLYRVLAESLSRPVSGIHILPFFPFSSDDGFSVINYTQVDPEVGTWSDVERLGRDFRLMFDAVINHVSRESDWFRHFLDGDPTYADWFLTVEQGTDLSQVVRPRALPLLTPVQTVDGKRLVWTTFSEDQIDLNFAHPAVLLKIIEILLFYVEKGAQLIRLDAIAYLWKKLGTTCIHLEETHRVVKLMRCALDAVAPEVLLITETNVPHEENISYFGAPLPESGSTDEAQLVYQFPLPPLIMYSILTGSARVLTEWSAGLEYPGAPATFFNFTASHDGIGVMPARGLLNESEIQLLVDATLAHGGKVSYKDNPDGRESVYELNISYFDALSDPASSEPQAIQVQRFALSQAIMLALAGLPGIYVHSLIGSRSWHEGVSLTGHNRTINREKLGRARLDRELADHQSLRYQVLTMYHRLLRARAAEPAFHPQGDQKVLDLDDQVLTLLRTAPDGQSHVLCVHNVSPLATRVRPQLADLSLPSGRCRDLLADRDLSLDREDAVLSLPPYAVLWLRF